MARLLDADLERGALLLEQLRPGTLLSTIADHEQATAIAARIMQTLWRPAPQSHTFPSVADWVQHMGERAPVLIGPLHAASPSHRRLAHWIEHAVGWFHELSSETTTPVLLHGDLHHFNILAAEREPWLAIDPFGVIGEPACEAAPWLFNRVPDPFDRDVAQHVLVPCVDQLAAELHIDRARLAAWGVVRSVIAAFWTLEDNGQDWDDVLGCAELLAEMAH
jgi:streptomycin 6-kinase